MPPGIIGRMTDRDRTSMEGSPACPFIAYEDERDERSTEPDHAHRCYAEVRPAPRALAHQEAYCLSSAFPVCPTFQAWARREAAQARSAGGGGGVGARPARLPPLAAPPRLGRVSGEDEAYPPAGARVNDDSSSRTGYVAPGEPSDASELATSPVWTTIPTTRPARRNPPRDWAAPPPWATGAAGAAAASRRGPDRVRLVGRRTSSPAGAPKARAWPAVPRIDSPVGRPCPT